MIHGDDRRVAVTRAGWVLLALAVVGTALLVSGPVMRERDQAALLHGSLVIARSGDLVGVGCYNYDRQFLSYWLTALVLRAGGADEAGAEPDDLVLLGNRFAAVLFAGCLAGYLLLQRRQGWQSLCLAATSVLAPCVLLSVPFLSSNVLSLSALLILAAVMGRGRRGWAGDGVCAVLSFVAVACRQDAALALPLLCLLAAPRARVGALFRVRRYWGMGLAALAAVALGELVKAGPSYNPGIFFEPAVYLAYVVFGLLGVLPVLMLLVPGLLSAGLRRRPFLLAMAGALLLPLAYYSFYLYSPRHLLLVAMFPLLFTGFSRGRGLLRVLGRPAIVRRGILAAAAFSLVASVVGVRFPDFPSFRPTAVRPTLYPTADGYWPMGTTVAFLARLEAGDEHPVDHCGRAWMAWRELDAAALPPGSIRIHSTGLVALGQLVLEMQGREAWGAERPGGEVILVQERQVGRSRGGFRGEISEDVGIDWSRCWLEPVVMVGPEAVYLLVPPRDSRADPRLRWVARLLFRQILGNNDFVLARTGDAQELRLPEGHRWALLASPQLADRWSARIKDLPGAGWKRRDLTAEEGAPGQVLVSFVLTPEVLATGIRSEIPGDTWAARATLPVFMSLDRL